MASDPVARARLLDDFWVGDWLVEPASGRLSREGTSVRLRPQLMDLLVCLASRAGRVVLKDDILEQVWPGQFIAESGLGRCMAELRHALQDDVQEPRFIETIPKRGYRLIAPVTSVERGSSAGGSVHPLAVSAPDDESPAFTTGAEAVVVEPSGAPLGAEYVDSPAARWTAGRGRRFVWIAVAASAVAATAIYIALISSRATPATLTDQDSLVLCFENHTGEAVFNGTLQFALAVHLGQSPFLRIISDEHVRQTLRLMGRPSDTALTSALAGEVCEREGARAMLVGSIARLGDRYVLGIEAVACPTGDSLAREQVQVDTKEEVLAGLGQIASRIRRALGESLASLERNDVPITQATTGSLEALRAVSLGDMERRRGRDEVAVTFYRQAVAFDPSFSLAYSHLGAALGWLWYANQRDEAITRAYQLRERTSLPERFEIEARYHQNVTNDFSRAIEALEALKRIHPRSSLTRRYLAQMYAMVGRHPEALTEALEAVRLEPNGSPEQFTLAQSYIHLNRFDEARKTAETAVARKIDSPSIHSILFDCAFIDGNAEAMDGELTRAAADPAARMLFLQFEAEAAVYGGKLREARSLLQRAGAIARERGDLEAAADLRLTEALYEALYGRPREVVLLVRDDLSVPSSVRAKVRVAVRLAFAGEIDRAAALLDDAEREPGHAAGEFWQDMRVAVRAMIENARGTPARAIEHLQPLLPSDLGTAYHFAPPVARGTAYLRAGNPTAAIAEFEKVLTHRGLDPSSEMVPIARLGIARAHALAGNIEASRRAYDGLLDSWAGADPDLPLLAVVRRERARLR